MLFALIGMVSAVSPGLPMVNFTGVPTSGPAPLTVDFTSVTQNVTLIKDTWSFGDGWQQTKINDPTITHVYQNPGKYDVTLEATNLIGSLGYTMTKTDYIYVTHVKPVAGFTFSPDGGPSPLEVTFTDTTTGFEPELLWDFGDGTSTTTDKNPVHTFTAGNVTETYTITLTATNDGGSDVYTDTITILPPVPVADFTTSSTTTGPVPLAVQFVDESTGVGIASWSWSFGDGGTSLTQNPLHAYGLVGLYPVSLTVTSPSGTDTKTRFHYINVTSVTGPVICPPIPEPTQCPSPSTTASKIGVYRPSNSMWSIDSDGDFVWEVTDLSVSWGQTGDLQVLGDWNGDGTTDIGVYRPSTGQWSIDSNGNDVYEPSDKGLSWGLVGDAPIIGDWNADGKDEIGVYRPSTGQWSLDSNGNYLWEITDKSLSWGQVGDRPIVVK
jgi:PKD repeat protein